LLQRKIRIRKQILPQKVLVGDDEGSWIRDFENLPIIEENERATFTYGHR
jgi:hypothetical protein